MIDPGLIFFALAIAGTFAGFAIGYAGGWLDGKREGARQANSARNELMARDAEALGRRQGAGRGDERRWVN